MVTTIYPPFNWFDFANQSYNFPVRIVDIFCCWLLALSACPAVAEVLVVGCLISPLLDEFGHLYLFSRFANIISSIKLNFS